MATLIASEKTATAHPKLKVVEIHTENNNHQNVKEFWIGRHPTSNLLLADSSISRKHACLKFSDHWTIMNNSANGVLINQKPIVLNEFVTLNEGDKLTIINSSNDFEWEFRISTKVPISLADQEIKSKRTEMSENHRLYAIKIKEDRDKLSEKIQEIENERKIIELQKQEMVKNLDEEQKYFSVKQANQIANFEIKMKLSKEEVVHEQKRLFEDRLEREKVESAHKIAEKERDLTAKLKEAEARLEKLLLERDNIIINLKGSINEIAEKAKNMRTGFETSLVMLNADCENERASAQIYKNEIEAIQKTFEETMKRNMYEMERIVENLRSEKEREKIEKQNIRKELEERDNEIARLKKALQNDDVLNLNKDYATQALVEFTASCPLDINQIRATSNGVSSRLKRFDSGNENDEKEKILSYCNQELKCSICDELFIEPITLACSHVYCKYCLDQWKFSCGSHSAKFKCPNCRQPVTEQVKSLHIEKLINSLYDGLSIKHMVERQKLVEERKAEEALAAEEREKEKCRKQQERAEFRPSHRRNHEEDSFIDISHETQNDTMDLTGESDSEGSDSDEDDSEASIDGVDGAYYPGWGTCFNCGRRGHWAPGCPF